MKKNIRAVLSGLLYLAALISVIEALTVTNTGGFFDLSGLARLVFCALAVICVIAAALIWKTEKVSEKKKKWIITAAAIVLVMGGGFLDNYLDHSTVTHEYTGDMFRIKEAVAARFETADGRSAVVDSEIGLLSALAELEIQRAPMTPADTPEDWVYRITYDPADQVSGREAVVVCVHEKYLQIGTEYYLPIGGGSFAPILEWFDSKAAYFMG